MPIYAIIGPSGSGKSSLVTKYVAEHPDAKLYKSATTRPQRDDSDNSHVFMTNTEFDAAIAHGEIINPVEAYGYRYGLPAVPNSDSEISIILIRAQFAPLLRKFVPSARIIQVEAEPQTLLGRVADRSDSSRDTLDSITAEIASGRQFADAIIKNDGEFDTAYREFTKIIQKSEDK